MWFKRAASITAALMVLLAAGCSAFGISRDDLIGDFQVDYGYAVETLRLSADGQYTQLVRLKDESTWTTHSGTWEFKDNPDQAVALKDSLLVDDGTGKPRIDWQKPVGGMRNLPVTWAWSLPAHMSIRTISLILDKSRNLTMAKLPQPAISDHKPAIIHLPPSNSVEVQ